MYSSSDPTSAVGKYYTHAQLDVEVPWILFLDTTTSDGLSPYQRRRPFHHSEVADSESDDDEHRDTEVFINDTVQVPSSLTPEDGADDGGDSGVVGKCSLNTTTIGELMFCPYRELRNYKDACKYTR